MELFLLVRLITPTLVEAASRSSKSVQRLFDTPLDDTHIVVTIPSKLITVDYLLCLLASYVDNQDIILISINVVRRGVI